MSAWQKFRQGDVLEGDVVDELVSLSVDKKPDMPPGEAYLLAVISQDCDIAQKEDREPYIEFALCKRTGKEDGNQKNGKNPRSLQIEEEGGILAFSVHDKFRVRKSDIAANIECQKGLSAFNLTVLKKWFGRRYTRAAFPDNFNKRLRRSDSLLRNEISSHVIEIYINVEDKELDDNTAYEPVILLVVGKDLPKTTRDQIGDAYDKYFTTKGIDPEVYVVTEKDITLADIRDHKRWDKDFYSLQGEESHQPGIGEA